MRKFGVGLLFFFVLQSSLAQRTSSVQNNLVTDNILIQWINQYPSPGNKNTHRSFFEQVARIVFGKKSGLNIRKPNAVLAKSPISYTIMDQGNEVLFNVENEEIRIPKGLKKTKFYFPSLVSMCYLSSTLVLFTDSKLNQLFLLDQVRETLGLFKTDTKLNQPTGIAYSVLSNEIWVVETGAHRIQIFTEKGALVKSIGSRGSKPGEFNYPTAIWIDKNGKAYIIDSMNFRIQVFDSAGKLISVFGEPGDASGYFARPKGIAVDSFGNIYITDALFHTVQLFDLAGNYLYNFGEQGRAEGQFWMPSGIFIDENNFIYIADSYNSRIQVFQLNKNE
jgi:hypothetical protein